MMAEHKTDGGYGLTDEALEKAAKYICNLKCGLCPMREKDFRGCSIECTEDVKPWKCWVAHFKGLSDFKAECDPEK